MSTDDQRGDDQGLVDDLLAIETGMTEWEVTFAESLSRWLEAHATLTGPQRDKAQQILEEKG
jgi:hypothetical protein